MRIKVTICRYEWRKNGFILDPTLPNIQRGADGTVTIHNATSMDEGFYQCFARNKFGTALTLTAHMQRAFLDSASRSPSVLELYLIPGRSFHITCSRLRSFPQPTYIWEISNGIKDTNPIQFVPTERMQIAENGRADLNS